MCNIKSRVYFVYKDYSKRAREIERERERDIEIERERGSR